MRRFRVFEGAVSAGAPSVVAYRLDPATLALSEVGTGAGELFGYPPEEWRRPDFWLAHVHPEDRDAVREFCRQTQSDLRSRELQYRLIGRDGRVLWVHDIIEVRDGGREIRGVLIDVTGYVTREVRPDSAARLKEELLRVVAEELAGPVRAISAYGEMLGRHLAAQRDDVGSDHAIGIRDGLQRLETVVGGLLRVAQGGDSTVDGLADGLAAIREARRGDR